MTMEITMFAKTSNRVTSRLLTVVMLLSGYGAWAQTRAPSSEAPAAATAPGGGSQSTSSQAAGSQSAGSPDVNPQSRRQHPAPAAGQTSQEPIPMDQAAPPPDVGSDDQAGMFVFKKEVQEVMLHATVLDGQRNLVPNLDRNAFTIFENGMAQPITSFRRQDVPVAMGIVVDNSGSMRDKRDEVNRAVLNLIRASNPQDEILVVNFSQNYYLDQDFTSDVRLLEIALHQVSSAGSTALYDAIVASSVHLRNNPLLEKKVLLGIRS